jgi:hypothetical protein
MDEKDSTILYVVLILLQLVKSFTIQAPERAA